MAARLRGGFGEVAGDDDVLLGGAQRLATTPNKNLQIGLLKRLLNSELRTVARSNVVAERKFSVMLEKAMRAYTNRSLDAAEIIRALGRAGEGVEGRTRPRPRAGLAEDELVFCDPVCENDSAVLQLGDDTLKVIAHELVTVVRNNASVDWDRREQVRALLRSRVRRLLTKYKYPPDKQASAITLVMQQAELLASGVAA